MTATVSLDDLLLALESAHDEVSSYVDRQTGRVVTITSEDRDADPARAPDWQQDSIADARAIDEDAEGRFLPVPDRFETDEWEMMRNFTHTLDDPDRAEKLRDALHGRGAFRRFKDALARAGQLEAWFRYREERYRDLAIEWCQEHGLAYSEGRGGANDERV